MDIAALDAVSIELAPGGQVILPIILAIMMLSISLNLHIEDFKRLLGDPWRFLGAASAQAIALPVATLILISTINPPPSVALGMIVVACCPGGTVSNFFTYMARGDVALSVSLTATSSLLAALVTPVSILFWSSLYQPTADLLTAIEVNPLSFVVQTTIILAVPIVIGMSVVRYYPDIAKRVRPYLLGLGVAGLIVMAGGGLASNWEWLSGVALAVFWIAVVHNLVAFVVGIGTGYALQYEDQKRRTMIIEIGIQNTGLALVILLSELNGLGGAAVIVGIWSIWHLFAGAVLAGAFRLYDRKRAG
jgi:BASS family bile acid:Na+ symporter